MLPKRYVIVGAGGVGAAIGGRLAEAGREVLLVARGVHLEALRSDGLYLALPERELHLRLPAVRLDELTVLPGDVLILTVKSQQTSSVLAQISGASAPLFCAQNGISNEGEGLRYFADVHGVCVNLPAVHLEPGRVEASGTPLSGVLRLGRFPYGSTDVDRAMADDLTAAGFGVGVSDDVMAWKRAKLLSNVGNALEALVQSRDDEAVREVHERAAAEARSCFVAANLSVTPDDEFSAQLAGRYRSAPVAGRDRAGGSTWQSIRRGQGSVETDFLNGEIVRLGRLYGVPTPVNARIQEAMRGRTEMGDLTPADLLG